MKAAIKKLTRLINIGFSSGHLAESETELIQAVNNFDIAFRQLMPFKRNPVKAAKSLRCISLGIAQLIYTVYTRSSYPVQYTRMIQLHLNRLYNAMQEYIKIYYHEHTGFNTCKLQHPETLFKKMGALNKEWNKTGNQARLLMLFQPYIEEVQKAKPGAIPCCRWLWWCCFYHYAEMQPAMGIAGLEDLLIALDFNVPGFKLLMAEKLKTGLAGLETVSEKAAYLQEEKIRYSLLMPFTQFAYTPAAQSVKHFMLCLCKTELKLLYAAGVQNKDYRISPQKRAEPPALKTCLSVPQAALLVRLMIEAGIVQSGNHTALIRQLAAILSTPRTEQVSAESLRVKFYTPDKAAKEMVKEYLFRMINHIRAC